MIIVICFIYIELISYNDITNLAIMDKQPLIINDNKQYTNIISVIGTYCNELTLFWFHRILYSQTLISVKIPKYIFIIIHNLNGTECVKYNRDITIYNTFISYLMYKYNPNLKVFIEFKQRVFGASLMRNYLSLMVNEYFTNHPTEKQNILIHGNLILSYFDFDDMIHPQKFDIIDNIYRNINPNMNGTLLHGYYQKDCRNYKDQKQMTQFEEYFDKISNIGNEIVIKNIILYLDEFHYKQCQIMLEWFKFDHIKYSHNLIEKKRIFKISKKEINHLNINDEPVLFWKVERKINHYSFKTANGWPIITLKSIQINPMRVNIINGEDQIFHIETINNGFDLYLVKYDLGVYCQGNITHKLSVINL